MINIGYGNYINSEKVLAVTKVDSAPFRRQRLNAHNAYRILECTMGRKALSLIHLEGGFLATSAHSPEIIKERLAEKQKQSP